MLWMQYMQKRRQASRRLYPLASDGNFPSPRGRTEHKMWIWTAGSLLSSLLQRSLPHHSKCAERNLRCRCRYDRNPQFLKSSSSGSGCYIHIVENTALNLKKTAQIKGELKGLKSLEHLAEMFGITDEDVYVKSRKSGRCRTCRSVQTGICFCRTD